MEGAGGLHWREGACWVWLEGLSLLGRLASMEEADGAVIMCTEASAKCKQDKGNRSVWLLH